MEEMTPEQEAGRTGTLTGRSSLTQPGGADASRDEEKSWLSLLMDIINNLFGEFSSSATDRPPALTQTGANVPQGATQFLTSVTPTMLKGIDAMNDLPPEQRFHSDAITALKDRVGNLPALDEASINRLKVIMTDVSTGTLRVADDVGSGRTTAAEGEKELLGIVNKAQETVGEIEASNKGVTGSPESDRILGTILRDKNATPEERLAALKAAALALPKGRTGASDATPKVVLQSGDFVDGVVPDGGVPRTPPSKNTTPSLGKPR